MQHSLNVCQCFFKAGRKPAESLHSLTYTSQNDKLHTHTHAGDIKTLMSFFLSAPCLFGYNPWLCFPHDFCVDLVFWICKEQSEKKKNTHYSFISSVRQDKLLNYPQNTLRTSSASDTLRSSLGSCFFF